MAWVGLFAAGCTENPLFGLGTDTEATSAATEQGSTTQSSDAPTQGSEGGVDSSSGAPPPTTTDPPMTTGVPDTTTGDEMSTGQVMTTEPPPGCGDGVVDADLGEECDNGALNSTDGACTPQCKDHVCGDGYHYMEEEECDEGANNSDSAACTSACKDNVCGDGLKLVGVEQCDNGAMNADDGQCRPGCIKGYCGDMVVMNGFEMCDDGALNGMEKNKCSSNCSNYITKEKVIRVSNSAVQGRIGMNGGVFSADSICADDFDGSYRAMIVDGQSRVAASQPWGGPNNMAANWVLQPYTLYRNIDDDVVDSTNMIPLLGNPEEGHPDLMNPIGVDEMEAWTGLNVDWTTGMSCMGWSTLGEEPQGLAGLVQDVFDKYLRKGEPASCSEFRKIYCVQYP